MTLSLILEWLSNYLPMVALLLIGFFVEDYYVSRLSIFSNSVALFSFYLSSSVSDPIVTLYASIGLVPGFLGLIAYIRGVELRVEYYELTFFTYSSATVGLAIVLFELLYFRWWVLLLAVGLGVIVNSKLLTVLVDRTVPLDDLPLPIEIARRLHSSIS